MRWLVCSLVYISLVSFSWGDSIGEYCKNFWDRKREEPYWIRENVSPLSFENPKVEGLDDKTQAEICDKIGKKIEGWDLQQCLFALRFLVMQDVLTLNEDGCAVWMVRYREYRKNGGKDFYHLDVEDTFLDTVRLANYNMDTFRNELKTRLGRLLQENALTEDADTLLQLMIGYCWGKIVAEKDASNRGKTPPFMFLGGGI